MIRRVTLALLVAGFLSPPASAQTPPAQPASDANPPQPPSQPQPPAANSAARSSLFDPVPTDPNHPAYHAGAHRTIVRHNPLPRRTGYDSNYSSSSGSSNGQSRQSGFSNAGVGRFGEYYDPTTLAPPVDNHAVPVGRFDNGGGPNRAEQLSAEQVGNQRAQTTQNTINTYGRPYGAYGAGFGYGLGLAGGGLYSFPN